MAPACPFPSPQPLQRVLATSAPAARAHQQGQAAVEFMAVLPLLAIAALACVQALLLALTLLFAQIGAQAASRQSLQPASLPVPPAWRRRASVHTSSGRVVVAMRSPAVLPAASITVRVDTASEPVT